MDSFQKLRIAVTILFLLSLMSLILVWTAPDYTEEYIDAFDSLTYKEQEAVEKYISYFPVEDDSSYVIIGVLVYVNIIGLGILTYKLWNIKEI